MGPIQPAIHPGSSRPSWELIEYWIPHARLNIAGLDSTLISCATPDSRAAFLRMTLANHKTDPVEVTLGVRAAFGALDRVTYVPVELRIAQRRCGPVGRCIRVVSRFDVAWSGTTGNARTDGQHGLYLVITTAGTKRWCVKYAHEGRTRIAGLGNWPEVSLQYAREKAIDLRRALKDGHDPVNDSGRRSTAHQTPRVSVLLHGYGSTCGSMASQNAT